MTKDNTFYGKVETNAHSKSRIATRDLTMMRLTIFYWKAIDNQSTTMVNI